MREINVYRERVRHRKRMSKASRIREKKMMEKKREKRE